MSTTTDFLGGQRIPGTQRLGASEEQNTPAATGRATPMVHSPQGLQSDRGQISDDAQASAAPVTPSPDGQCHGDPHESAAAGGQTPQAPDKARTAPKDAPLGLADPLLALLADVLDDLERTRIANENRLRQLTRTEEDEDGELRGLGLPIDDPAVARIHAVVNGLSELEHAAELNLARRLRTHPLGPWVKRTPGVGEKQGARLLAAIGDPYWNTLHGRPRTVSELWAYAGYHVIRLPATSQGIPGPRAMPAGGEGKTSTVGQYVRATQVPSADGAAKIHSGHGYYDTQGGAAGVGKPGDPDHDRNAAQSATVGVAPTRARGQRANWSPTAKMRAFLIAETCVKGLRKPCERADGEDYAVHVEGCACFPYRLVYDAARVKYADAVHQAECRRCGPAGKPALPGSPLNAGHKQARALRAISKQVLEDLWIEARAIHHAAYGDPGAA